MELGNLIMGNSRGKFDVPRDLVNCDEWEYLVHVLLQVEDYHCMIGEKYFQDYKDNLEYKERTNNLKPTKYGGFKCEYNDEVIFELFPYWWGECTCGADEENDRLYELWQKELFTDEEYELYMTFDEWCDDNCPATFLNEENDDLTEEQLLEKCTCGAIRKNIELKKKKESIKDKINEFEKRELTQLIPHKEDCCLVIPNFIYHPGKEDEFSIQWYKYPFRDSYMNRDLTNDEIKNIFKDCAKYLELVIKECGGTW